MLPLILIPRGKFLRHHVAPIWSVTNGEREYDTCKCGTPTMLLLKEKTRVFRKQGTSPGDNGAQS